MLAGHPKAATATAIAVAVLFAAEGGAAERPTTRPARSDPGAQRGAPRSQLLGLARRYLVHHRCPGLRGPSQLASRMALELRLHPTTLAAAAESACNTTRAVR